MRSRRLVLSACMRGMIHPARGGDYARANLRSLLLEAA
jgi:hypothetical protein